MRTWCLCLAACMASSGVVGSDPTPPAPTPDYSKEAFVVEDDTNSVVFENDGTGTRERAVRIRIQSDAAVQRFGLLTFNYQESSERLDFPYIRVIHPDGSTVSTPEDSIQDMPSDVTRQAPFYSDIREKHVAVRGLGTGDTLEFRARTTILHPMIPGHFWLSFDFERDLIVLRQELRIAIPLDRPVKWKSTGPQPTVVEEGSRRVLTWTGSSTDVKSPDQKPDPVLQEETAYRAVRGRLRPPEIQLSSFQSWEDVGRWYGSLQRDRVAPTAEIRSKAAELTKDLSTEDERIRAIYRYVSGQYRYIGIAFGIGRYQPHFASEVLANRYGDCKDKHTLLASLLEAAGIKAVPALIHSSLDIDPDMPSPAGINHVISVVPRGSELLWLDTTAEVAPFGYLLSLLQDKHALVVAREDAPRLVSTPAQAASPSSTTFHLKGKLRDDGTMEATIEQSLQGNDREVLLRGFFRGAPMSQWKTVVQQMSYLSGFAGEVSEVTATPPERTDEPFRFTYRYARENYSNWAERSIGPALANLMLPELPEGRTPSQPIWLGQPGEVRLESEIEVPKGYAPTLPAGVSLSEAFATYSCLHSFKDGIFATKRRLVWKAREVPLDQVEAYRKFREAVNDDQELLIPFSTGVASLDAYQDEIWTLPASTNPTAVRVIDELKGRTSEPKEVIAVLERAVAIDPGFTRAWLWLGEMYTFAGNHDAALRAYRRGIESDPTRPVGYRALGTALRRRGKMEESLSVWRDLIQIAPANPAGHVGLASTLSEMGRHAEAASTLEAAIALSPPRPQLQRLLGAEYLRNGDEQKAMAAFEKTLEQDPRPGTYNDVAYDLADASKSLPLALEYARRAVRETEEASTAISLADLHAEDLKITPRLGAYWDTLGWVHFRAGNLDLAEQYLDASWTLSQDAVTASHLGQVREARGEKDSAIRTYRLGLAASSSSTTGKTVEKELRSRIERLGGKVESSGGRPDGGEKLGLSRTFDLPEVTVKDASADFFLRVGPRSEVEDVKFIRGSDALKSAAKALASKNLDQHLPADGAVHLVRRGIVSCSKSGKCVLVLIPPERVNSVD